MMNTNTNTCTYILPKDVVLYLSGSINQCICSKHASFIYIEYIHTHKDTQITYCFLSLVRLWANTVPDRATEYRIGARVR